MASNKLIKIIKNRLIIQIKEKKLKQNNSFKKDCEKFNKNKSIFYKNYRLTSQKTTFKAKNRDTIKDY